MPTPPPAQVHLVLPIAPDRDGKTAMSVSMRSADGTQGPPQKVAVDVNWRVAAFAATVQTIAGQQLASIKSAAIGRPDLMMSSLSLACAQAPCSEAVN